MLALNGRTAVGALAARQRAAEDDGAAAGFTADFAVAGLVADGETTIEGWESVADSFPGFAELLTQVAS